MLTPFFRLTLLFCFYLLFGLKNGVTQVFPIKNYSVSDGLSQSDVYCSLTDSRGYVWVGTEDGLNRFNGQQFIRYSSSNGLAGNTIRALYEDKKGTIWIACSGGLSVYDGLEFKTIEDTLFKGSTVLSILEDSRGRIWAGTDDGGINVLQFASDRGYSSPTITTISTQDGLNSNTIFDLCQVGNKIYATNFGGALTSIQFEGEKPVVSSITFDNKKINTAISLEKISDHEFWMGTYGEGLFRVKIDSNRYTLQSISDQSPVWDIKKTSSNEVYFVNGKQGIIRYQLNDSSSFLLNSNNGLSSNQVLSIQFNQDNSIWFGTNGSGLDHFYDNGIRYFNEQSGINKGSVQALSFNTELWVSHQNNEVLSLQSNQNTLSWKSLNVLGKNIDQTISCIEVIHPQEYYLGTSKGVCLVKDGNASTLTKKEGLYNDNIYALAKDQTGVLWMGTADGISSFDGQQVNVYSTNYLQLNQQGVFDVVVDKNNTKWYATADGLVQIKQNNLKEDLIKVYHQHKEDRITIRGLFLNGDVLWFFSAHRIYSINTLDANATIKAWQHNKLIQDYSIKSLVWVDKNTLLLGSNSGLLHLKINEENADLTVINGENGLLGKECGQNLMVLDSNNLVYLCTEKGINQIDVSKFEKSVPKIQLKEFDVHFKPVDWSNSMFSINSWSLTPKNLRLKSTDNHLTFHVEGVELNTPKRLVYQFRLNGFHEEWSSRSTQNFVRYPKLPFGSYAFQARASVDGKTWSAPVEYSFAILPPWYRTWWFYVCCFIAFIISFYLVVLFRERKLRKEKKILEEKVAKRTHEVVVQKEEIEEQRTEIMDSISYAKRLQKAILLPEEEIRNALPESFVLFLPKDLVSGDFYWMKENNTKTFFSAVDCTGHGVPGAFMSIIGNNGLNKCVDEFHLPSPSLILDSLSEIVEKTFIYKGEGQVKDGMDISLVAIPKQGNILEFSGANNPLYIVRKPEQGELVVDGETIAPNILHNKLHLFEIKACKQPIGHYEGRIPFKNSSVELMEGDAIYSFTDGFPDQFGGEKGKKFKYKPFKRLLLEVNSLPYQEQKLTLEKTLFDWKGTLEQVDDICIFYYKWTNS